MNFAVYFTPSDGGLRMPVDMNRAGFVRHTGLTVETRPMPRALLPAAISSEGVINLSALRNPDDPINPNGKLYTWPFRKTLSP